MIQMPRTYIQEAGFYVKCATLLVCGMYILLEEEDPGEVSLIYITVS
jgi:hypothetical protein